MVEYINQHQDQFWFVVGFALLALEILVMGVGTGVVLFAGIGALITGLLFWLGVPAGWITGIALFTVSTALSALLLWKPLKRLNRKPVDRRDRGSDFVGHTFYLETDVTLTAPGGTRFSGVDWKVEIARNAGVDRIASGTEVRVDEVEVGVLRVIPV